MDFEDLVSRELQCKVLEVDEEVDRLVLSNRKNNISSAKLSYNVRLSPPLPSSRRHCSTLLSASCWLEPLHSTCPQPTSQHDLVS